jgi:uncharacterized protein YciI
MFIIVLRYIKPMEEIDKVLAAHREFLKSNYQKGIFLLSGRQVPRTGGVILAKAKSRQELEAIAKQDPFYLAGVSTFEIIEFIATMSAPGLETLKDE